MGIAKYITYLCTLRLSFAKRLTHFVYALILRESQFQSTLPFQLKNLPIM